MPSLRSLCLLLALLLPSAAGCDVLAPEPEEEFILYVAPHTVECQGMVVQQCMLTRRSPDAEWTYFYGEIIGFDYEPGFHWTLRVSTRAIPNPPQDSSSIEYRLLAVLEQVPADGS